MPGRSTAGGRTGVPGQGQAWRGAAGASRVVQSATSRGKNQKESDRSVGQWTSSGSGKNIETA